MTNEERRARNAWEKKHYKKPCPECGKSLIRRNSKGVCVKCRRAPQTMRAIELWNSGMSTNQVALELGVEVGTVGKLLARARKRPERFGHIDTRRDGPRGPWL